MNIITVEGGKKKQRQMVEDVVSYMIQRQMPRMRTLDIHVTLKKIDDARGYCMSETNREFEIEVDKRLRKNEFISTVIHEMVHVWQSATRKMKDLPFGRKMYMGKVYDETTAYEDEPWEIEAYDMQGGLLEKFKEEYVI